jgi:hypothetical protein
MNVGPNKISRILLVLTCSAYCTGCGSSGPSHAAVSGKVTLDGQAVQQGKILFEPTAKGKMSVGEIADGAYAIPEERGPTVGTCIVRITATRPTGKKLKAAVYADDQTPVDVLEQYIPAKFNQLSNVRVDIDPTAYQVHDFALNSSQSK